jgi:hypothetical protein
MKRGASNTLTTPFWSIVLRNDGKLMPFDGLRRRIGLGFRHLEEFLKECHFH